MRHFFYTLNIKSIKIFLTKSNPLPSFFSFSLPLYFASFCCFLYDSCVTARVQIFQCMYALRGGISMKMVKFYFLFALCFFFFPFVFLFVGYYFTSVILFVFCVMVFVIIIRFVIYHFSLWFGNIHGCS